MHKFMCYSLQDVILPVEVRVRNGCIIQKIVKLVENQSPILHRTTEAVDIHHVHLVEGVGHTQQRLKCGHTLGADLCWIICISVLKIGRI